MLKRMKQILCVFLMILILSSNVFAYSSDIILDESVTLSNMDKEMTLVDALKQYPELQDIYPVKIISAEEAAEKISQGVPVLDNIDAESILAVPYLSQFNAVKKTPLIIDEIDSLRTKDELYQTNSAYGAAWPYTVKNGTTPNCYSYAIGVYSKSYDPGGLSIGAVTWGSSVNTVASRVLNDMAAAFNGGSRSISSNMASINSYEWRIACRVGHSIIPLLNGEYIEQWDYHFWLQTSAGTWCHKPGKTPSELLGNVTPHNENWNLKIDYGNGIIQIIPNFYNSTTKYLAVHSG